ncbi:VanZ family protein [Marinicella gelatinilytica]|uniref:VanZ family protein n=1 Tax=Marinicella gelatinilytica TaxID=2996017 RepID=UPI002260F70A|nr:VanZ family protein [Marinicella gelatinilytica]MCX7545707.1 VanZ family protein [Marinicella gelatinilytica]
MAVKNKIAHGIGWLLVILIWLLSLLPLSVPTTAVEGGDKIGHFVAYAVMTYWFLHLYPKTWLVIWAFIVMGVMIEVLQGLTTFRFFEWADILANGLGVVVAWFVFGGLKVHIKILCSR